MTFMEKVKRLHLMRSHFMKPGPMTPEDAKLKEEMLKIDVLGELIKIIDQQNYALEGILEDAELASVMKLPLDEALAGIAHAARKHVIAYQAQHK